MQMQFHVDFVYIHIIQFEMQCDIPSKTVIQYILHWSLAGSPRAPPVRWPRITQAHCRHPWLGSHARCCHFWLTQARQPTLTPAKSKLQWIRFRSFGQGCHSKVQWNLFPNHGQECGSMSPKAYFNVLHHPQEQFWSIDQVLSVLSRETRLGHASLVADLEVVPESTLWGPLTLLPAQGGLWCSRHAQ